MPLSRDVIPKTELRRLAEYCPIRMSGRLSDEDTAVMVMILPDLCGELFTLRKDLETAENTYSIPNRVLVELYKDTPGRHMGELTDREHLLLSARLSGMCRELLTLRSQSIAEAA